MKSYYKEKLPPITDTTCFNTKGIIRLVAAMLTRFEDGVDLETFVYTPLCQDICDLSMVDYGQYLEFSKTIEVFF